MQQLTPVELASCVAKGPVSRLPSAQDNWGSDALMMAAAQGHAAAVRLLLSRGANPNAWDCQVGATTYAPLALPRNATDAQG